MFCKVNAAIVQWIKTLQNRVTVVELNLIFQDKNWETYQMNGLACWSETMVSL